MQIWFRTPRPPPGKEAWKPSLNRGAAPAEPVSERLRRLRLRRGRRTAQMRPVPVVVHVALVLAAVGFLLLVAKVLSIPAR